MKFESNVIYIGTKTYLDMRSTINGFESNVIYIGTKTEVHDVITVDSLRVM